MITFQFMQNTFYIRPERWFYIDDAGDMSFYSIRWDGNEWQKGQWYNQVNYFVEHYGKREQSCFI